jgi:transposase-like protein
MLEVKFLKTTGIGCEKKLINKLIINVNCNAKGRMEAHEIWHYNDETNTQKLGGLICLCNLCHLTMHLGFAEIQGKLPDVQRHLGKVNGWSKKETQEYIEAVFEVWFMRSKKQWTLDLKFLDDCGIVYSLISPQQRENISNSKK